MEEAYDKIGVHVVLWKINKFLTFVDRYEEYPQIVNELENL